MPAGKCGWLQMILLFLIMRCTPTIRELIEATLAIAVLSIGYQSLGSCSRAAGWSAATLCCGTNRRLEVGQSMSALPGYFRHQLVPLLPKHHPLRSQDT